MGQYLTFTLQDEQYGVAIEVIREINRVTEITPVPRAPRCLKGVMNLRGKIVPVIDLRLKFDLPEQPPTRETCIMIIDTSSGPMGVIVDAVREVVELAATQIEAPPAAAGSAFQKCVQGLGKLEDRVVILIDILTTLSETPGLGDGEFANVA